MGKRRAPPGSTASWAALPCALLELVLDLLDIRDRVAASGACKAWRQVAQGSPALWRRISFSTHRNGSRRSELRRLRSLAAWAQRYAAHTQHLAISARVPAECQQQALKAVAQAALACASLESLSITANRGFWPAWLPSLGQLRQLHLCSKEGGLSLHGDLTPLQLTELVLEARHAVALADSVRLPPSVVNVELSCIRDTLPPQLSQLSGLRRLRVRRGLVSEGVLLTEYEALSTLTALTSLALERQEDEAWVLPPELLALTALRHLSIAGNDCSRWSLHGSDETMDTALRRMPHLTSLDISNCSLEELPPVLAQDPADEAATRGGGGSGSEEEEDGAGRAAAGPRLLRLLAHGNQLEAGGEPDEEQAHLVFPRTLRQLSLDVHLLRHLPSLRLPPRCRQLALVGEEREVAMRILMAGLPDLIPHLPGLRHLILEPAAMWTLDWLRREGCQPALQLVAGHWRPTRLPGQPVPPRQGQDVLKQLEQAGIRVVELERQQRLPELLSELEAEQG